MHSCSKGWFLSKLGYRELRNWNYFLVPFLVLYIYPGYFRRSGQPFRFHSPKYHNLILYYITQLDYDYILWCIKWDETNECIVLCSLEYVDPKERTKKLTFSNKFLSAKCAKKISCAAFADSLPLYKDDILCCIRFISNCLDKFITMGFSWFKILWHIYT